MKRESASPVAASRSLAINRYSPDRSDDWDAYVRRASSGTFCHLSGWSRVVERTFGHPSYSLFAERDGVINGVLPLFHVRGPLVGSILVSTPAAIYGGALADDAEARQKLVAEAIRLADDLDVDYLELRDCNVESDESEQSAWLRSDLYVTFARSITADAQALLRSYPKNVRYMIRQGFKHRLRSELGGQELLDSFYELYAANMHRLGTPVYAKSLFAEFLREFPHDCDLLVLRQGRRPVAATMNFYFRDTVLAYYGCALRAAGLSGLSNYLYFELMRLAAARGFTRFDFGRSKVGSGSWSFKRAWKMESSPLPYRFFLIGATRMPQLNPTNPRLRPLIEAWKRLPLGLTKLLGPAIVRYIP